MIGNRNDNAILGEAQLEAFAANDRSLGKRAVDTGESSVTVSRLFDGALISAFQLSSVEDYQVIAGLRYAPCTE